MYEVIWHGRGGQGVVVAAQQFHAEHAGLKGERFFQIDHAHHGVKNSHRFTSILKMP